MKEPKIEIISQDNAGYCHLLDSISTLWSEAKERAIVAVNTELLDTNWKTGQYIVEYEQGGKGSIWQATPHPVGERPHHSTWQGLQPLQSILYEKAVSHLPKM